MKPVWNHGIKILNAAAVPKKQREGHGKEDESIAGDYTKSVPHFQKVVGLGGKGKEINKMSQ